MVLRQSQGARSICFIGGDPAPHIPFILDTVAALGTRRTAPIVINSNFYLTDEALDLLDPAVDIYLPDLKFGPGRGKTASGETNDEETNDQETDCGADIGGMPGYWPVVTGCIDRLYRNGKQMIVRHLLMPGHYDCCTVPVLQWLGQRPGLPVSLLTQYVAPAHARGELASPLADEDVTRAQALAREIGLTLVE